MNYSFTQLKNWKFYLKFFLSNLKSMQINLQIEMIKMRLN